ncbi:MAG: hypothetical protein LC730_06130 [Acidobacteria bacterium]|nr:hypothetical protein [Acidobacteriota bacterium]MCA1609018.1 hypothetical protein [Acidobacteriota bacterium]
MKQEEKLASTDPHETDTASPDKPDAEWKMPEPVFRRTSGVLPHNFEKQTFDSTAAAMAADASDETAAPAPVPQGVSDTAHLFIDPPPENSHQAFLETRASVNDSKPQRGKGVLRIVLISLASLAIVGSILVFLVLVYLFNFGRASRGGDF